jgi:hypothetical protein
MLTDINRVENIWWYGLLGLSLYYNKSAARVSGQNTAYNAAIFLLPYLRYLIAAADGASYDAANSLLSPYGRGNWSRLSY